MSFYQLTPTIPLRSPKASGEAIGLLDYSIDHDLMWVIVDDATGEIWTVPNKDVRAYANYSAGRNLKHAQPRDADDVLAAFIAQWVAQPAETERLLRTCLDENSLTAALRMIARSPTGSMPAGNPSWMPDFTANGATS